MHPELVLLALFVPVVVFLVLLWARWHARTLARREMIRRNKVCRDWMKDAVRDDVAAS